MISEYKQWKINLVVAIAGAFLTLVGVAIAYFAWQHPKSPADSPTTSDYANTVSMAVEGYFKRAKLEEVEKKYVRTFALTSSEGWVNTGIVLQRNHRIFVRRNDEEDGTRNSDNNWVVLTNVWDSADGTNKTISDYWDAEGHAGEIETNDILGTKTKDTLKLSAYWVNQGPITVDVIIDYDNYLEEYPSGYSE